MIGLLGRKLVHSYSPEIHKMLSGEQYHLIEKEENQLDDFFRERNFKFISVTLPYKEKVIKYLDELDESAKMIGCVNTIINKDGHLTGYNTDAYGFESLLRYNRIDIKNKKVLILGSGATSKTVKNVLLKLKAKEVYVVSRTPNKNAISYERAQEIFDIDVIVNTTPVGMYPNEDSEVIIDVQKFPYLESVIDVVYNPLNTKLLINARIKGCKTANGLYMLVAQAARVYEILNGEKVKKEKIEEVYFKLLLNHNNLILIGMPSVGKTTAARNIARELNKEHIDTDKEIENVYSMLPGEIITQKGVEFFRKIETNIIKQLSLKKGVVISVGGGTLLDEENVRMLLRNGYMIFLNRSIELLKLNKNSYKTRPLLTDPEAFDELFAKRYEIYKKCSDYEYCNNGSSKETYLYLLKKMRITK